MKSNKDWTNLVLAMEQSGEPPLEHPVYHQIYSSVMNECYPSNMVTEFSNVIDILSVATHSLEVDFSHADVALEHRCRHRTCSDCSVNDWCRFALT